MYLSSISLQQFKNLEDQQEILPKGLVVLSGENGAGKTNFLDAVYLLGNTRSALGHGDAQMASNGKDFFAVKAEGEDNQLIQVRYAWQRGQGKAILWQGKQIEKMSEHLGRLPALFFSPNDTDIIRQSGEIRRKFFDSLLCELYPSYLKALSRFQLILASRNRALKEHYREASTLTRLLKIYDQEFADLSKEIIRVRTLFNDLFGPKVEAFYRLISNDKEKPDIRYIPSFETEDIGAELEMALEKDRLVQHSSIGPHRDEWSFLFKEKPMKKFASQGQQQSFALALKLARQEIVTEQLQKPPILLLDDVFGKLDSNRMKNLIALLSGLNNQIFLTDARPEQAKAVMEHFSGEKAFFLVEKGKLILS